MATYTIAYLTPRDGNSLLLGLAPDGPDARAKARAEALDYVAYARLGDDGGTEFADEESNITYEDGISLTNEFPDDIGRIAWYASGVELSYENVQFKYAVRPEAPPERIW